MAVWVKEEEKWRRDRGGEEGQKEERGEEQCEHVKTE